MIEMEELIKLFVTTTTSAVLIGIGGVLIVWGVLVLLEK